MTDLPRFRIATQALGATVLWDSQTGERISVYDTRAEAQVEADRLNAWHEFEEQR